MVVLGVRNLAGEFVGFGGTTLGEGSLRDDEKSF